MSKLFGILNVTSDSFSDGGQFLNPERAESHALSLLKHGADWIEISGQSSNISANLVTEDEEWKRIAPLFPLLKKQGAKISLDSFRPEIQYKALIEGALCLNDITGFTHPDSKNTLANELKNRNNVYVIIMFSHTNGFAKEESELTPGNVIETILFFLRDRQKELLSWGIAADRIYFDPGMGFFLGKDPELSFTVLRKIDKIMKEFPNLMVSVSRKSFLGNILGGLPPQDREFATLAVEIYLLQKKVPWIRTHNIQKLKQSEIIYNLLSS